MTTFQKLKHEARRAEQRSDWARAIDLYQRALETDEDMADLSLYNRIGDLYLRLNQNDSAVESYERAIERYADNGMHTSAIALCNKILRIAPGRFSVYRRLGLLHARTGLVVEARAACLNYVRHALESGSVEEAAAAVDEFVELSGDEQIRLGYSEALSKHGDSKKAADQLRAVIRERSRRGVDTTELAARLEKLVPGDETGLAPDTDVEDAAGAPPARSRLADLVAARLGEAGWTGAFDPERPSFTEDDGAEPPDGLDAIRRELARFRRGVEDVLAANDLTVRYDLGVEFMTIGLLDEAIEEFQVAVSDPALVEAANARIGECLALRTSGLAFDLTRRFGQRADGAAMVADAASPAAEADEIAEAPESAEESEPAEAPEPAQEPAPTAGSKQRTGASQGSSPWPEFDELDDLPDLDVLPELTTAAARSAGERASAEDGLAASEEDELQGHFFRARLAQYRIRRAEERHTVDHQAHLDLGSAYVQMELHQEALRELCVAFDGPRPISGRAARALKRLAVQPNVAPELALEVLERLAAADSGAAADTLGAELAEAWGVSHPMADRLARLREGLSEALAELPALEDMFPGLGESAMAVGEAQLAPEAGGSPDVTVAASEADDEPADEADDDSLAGRLSRAAELADAGAAEDAAGLLERTLREVEGDKRLRDALVVLDRLLELEPDDLGRHERRAELAGMVDDRDHQLAAYAALAEAHRRRGDTGAARVAYGRMLDLDDANELARRAIARIDADELEIERLGEEQRRGNGRPAAGGSPEDEAEVEALLDGLEADDEDVRPVGPGEDVDGGDPDADGDKTARSQYELGLAFRQMGMWNEAVRELRAALRGVADRLKVLEALGECLLKAGRDEEAVKLLESNLRADEDEEQVGPLYFFGLALLRRDQPERAKEVFARVEAARPGYRDAAERLSELSL